VIDATKQIKSHHFGGQSPTERQRIANGFSGGQRSRTAENFWVLLEG
jgi:ABC-type microcin C transport system duplicated ATPase subunit YejF